VLGNLTLGTGLVYVSQLGARQGALAFVAPFAVFVGYFALSQYTNRLKDSFAAKPECKSYIDFLKLSGQCAENRIVWCYAWLQAVVFIMLCAFELYASSELLTRLIDFGLSPMARFLVALTLLFVAVGYTWAGGLRAAIGTDWIQAHFIVLALVILLFVVWDSPLGAASDQGKSAPSIDRATLLNWPTALAVFVVFYNAVATQFYSALNLSISTNYSPDGKVRVLEKTGWFVALTLCIFVVIGMLLPQSQGAGMDAVLSKLLGALGASDKTTDSVMAAIIVAGFLALLLSTLDGTLVVIQQTLWELYTPRATFDQTESPIAIKRARLFTAAVGLAIAVVLLLFTLMKADLIPLVLTVVWPLSFLAPILAISAFFAARHNQTVLSGLVAQSVLIIIVLGFWGLLFVTTANGLDITGQACLACVIAAAIHLGLEYAYARRSRLNLDRATDTHLD
jgi:Na+/proline symporter